MESHSFRGTSLITLDAKGRITVPAKYRVILKNMVIAPNFFSESHFLFVYSQEQWNKVLEDIFRKPKTLVQEGLTRHFVGRSVECSPDSGGRVLVPKDLRDFAGIDKKIALVGVGKKIEMWSEELHKQSYNAFVESVSLADMRNAMMDVDY